jgi:hypothetical protein
MTDNFPVPGVNGESYGAIRWILDNADSGFYLFTAALPMQQKVSDMYLSRQVAVYDYSRDTKSSPYSYGEMEQYVKKRQEARIFLIINLQAALQKPEDIQNFNLSRDMLARLGKIWIFGMTPDLDDLLATSAYDFYSYIRLKVHFQNEPGVVPPLKRPQVVNAYPFSPELLKKQLKSYQPEKKRLMSLSLEETEPQQLLSAAITLSNIAELYCANSDYKYALSLYERIALIRENILGKEHPDTAATYSNIAKVCDNMRD